MHTHTRTLAVLFDSVVFPIHLLDFDVVLQDWQNQWTKPPLLKSKAQRLNIKSTMIWQSIYLGNIAYMHCIMFNSSWEEFCDGLPELILVFSDIIPKHNHLFHPTQIKTLCFDYSQWFSDKSYTRTHSCIPCIESDTSNWMALPNPSPSLLNGFINLQVYKKKTYWEKNGVFT